MTLPASRATSAALLLLASAALGRAQADAPATEAKTYVLFQGDNISVGTGPNVYPVEDVTGASWVVVENGQQTVVSAKDGPIDMKDVPTLKLTEISATIADLKTENAYTYENDPAVKLTRALGQSADISAGASSAAAQASATAASPITAPFSQGAAGSNVTISQTPTLNSTGGTAGVGAGAASELRATQANTEGYDAIDVSFRISSKYRFNTPYVVTFSWFRDATTEAGNVRKLVYARALDPIGLNPTNVHFLVGGFPVGFQLQNIEIHLYNRGEEIATNVAPKRVEMTRDEAFDYVRTKYIESHKGFTLPALPVMGDLPPDLHEHLAKGEYAAPVYVRISKDGLADRPYSDPACTKPIDDPYLTTVVRSIRFKPALNQGVPVDSLGTVDVAKLRV
jgi:hypothetical protein